MTENKKLQMSLETPQVGVSNKQGSVEAGVNTFKQAPTTPTANQNVAPKPATNTQQPLPKTNQTGLNSQEIAELVAGIVSTTAQVQAEKERAQRQLDEEARELRNKSHTGEAILNFSAQMQKEIKDGDYVDILYNPGYAKTHGKLFSMSINGYRINFIQDHITRVPKSLHEEVNFKLNKRTFVQPNLEDQENTLKAVSLGRGW